MDVQCERCKTEYEFDDALVSGRGTTVRCTNCGHQFKVRKAEVSEPGADRWGVRTSAGQELTFLTLRELQRAILAKQVGRGDILRRGQTPPRALGAIAELEPFFDGRASSRPPPGSPAAAGAGRLPPAPAVPRGMPEALEVPRRTASWGLAPENPQPAAPPPRPKIDTLRPPGAGVAPPPAPPMAPVASSLALARTEMAPARIVPVDAEYDPVTQRKPVTPPPPAVRAAPPASPLEVSSPLPPATAPVRRSHREDDYPSMRPSIPSAGLDDYAAPPRRRVGGWIVAVVLLLAVGVVGWVVAKPYLVRPMVATPQLDPRAAEFVAAGERYLSEGDIEAAQQAFDKASALAERDPRVLADEATVAAVRADVPWLRMRLLADDDKEDRRITKADLDDRVARARKAADAAVASAPDDPAALRARVDSLRLAGDRDAARRDVSKIIAQAAQPETAYVLAALDLAEPEPLWTTLLDRLRLAASREGNAGRARAALVYALAQSGDVAGAKAELAKLDSSPRPYALLRDLHAFIERLPARGAAVGGAASSVPHLDVSALPLQPSAPAAAGAVAAAGGGGSDEAPVPGDNGSAMRAAQAAIRKGDWERARTIYEALVARNPGDSEALSGLGDVSRATGDTAGALAAYKRALGVNPSYLPALLGVADTQWASGDHAGAVRAYKDIIDRFPEGTYPGYAKTRVDGMSGGGAPTPTATVSASAPSAASAPAPSPAPTGSDGI